MWDPRVQEPVVSLEPAEGEAKRDCWAVAFGALRCALLGPRKPGSAHSCGRPRMVRQCVYRGRALRLRGL